MSVSNKHMAWILAHGVTSSGRARTWAHVFGQICWRFKSSSKALSDPEISLQLRMRGKHRHTHSERVGMNGQSRVKDEEEGRRGGFGPRKRPRKTPGFRVGTGRVVMMRSVWMTKVRTDTRREVTTHQCCAYFCYSSAFYEWKWRSRGSKSGLTKYYEFCLTFFSKCHNCYCISFM